MLEESREKIRQEAVTQAMQITMELRQASRFVEQLNASMAVLKRQGTATREDINRLTATATYSYDLTEAVSADIGYRFRSRQQDPTDAQSNAIFFQIGRTFETIP